MSRLPFGAVTLIGASILVSSATYGAAAETHQTRRAGSRRRLSARIAGCGRHGPRLHSAKKLDMASAGASAPDSRKFLVIVRLDGSSGPRVVEWQDGKTVPYPSGQWNAWRRGDDPAKGVVRVNAQRIGPNGKLWLIDVGAPGIGDEVLQGGAKLVRVDLAINTADRVYPPSVHRWL